MKMFLNGEWVGREHIVEIRNPDDGSLVDTVPIATPNDVKCALAAGVAGRQVAASLPTHVRAAILRRTADAVLAKAELYARTIASEGVKTIREARIEVGRCANTLRLSAEEATRLEGEVIPFDQVAGGVDRTGYFFAQQIGLVLAITPFNDPLNLVAHKVGPAIAAGNSIILKPHSATPLVALMLAEDLLEAGLPGSMLQVLTGSGRDIVAQLLASDGVNMVTFTGGRETGTNIARLAGLRKLAMELGSNAPTIVLGDADIELAVKRCVSGAFWAAGQNCLHVQRILIEKSVFDEFRDMFVAMSSVYNLGPKLDEKTDMGPLINESAARRVDQVVSMARELGGRVLLGGPRDGCRIPRTIIEGVDTSMDLVKEEIYGPVTFLSRVESLDEAIAQANAVDYGLQSAVFTSSLTAAHKAIKLLDCGAVMINETTDFRIDAMPFGGTKESGLGREGVRWAVREMTQPKVVCIKA